jgi:hypothetical protein
VHMIARQGPRRYGVVTPFGRTAPVS